MTYSESLVEQNNWPQQLLAKNLYCLFQPTQSGLCCMTKLSLTKNVLKKSVHQTFYYAYLTHYCPNAATVKRDENNDHAFKG